ncbi:hypothetical protein ACUTSW_05400 [Serratia sp. TSA_198.1]|uniref:hypothetical protein n=1 Tax=Serratia sp. TSA_198.1 TaxID=3415664 RepID=UPI004045311A
MNEEIEDIKKSIKERVSGPLGYITLSFIVYNWSWFYFLIFSDKMAEVKITSILRFFPKACGIGIPILVGTILAIAMPFVRLKFKQITALARKLESISDHDEKNAVSNHIANKDIELANKNFELTTKTAAIEEIKTEREALNSEILSLHGTLETARLDHTKINETVHELKKEKHELEVLIAAKKIDIDTYNDLKIKIEGMAKEIISLEKELDGWKKSIRPERSSIATLLSIIKTRPDWMEFMHPSERDDVEYIAKTIKYNHEIEKGTRYFLAKGND